MALIPTTQVNVSPDDYKRKIAYALMQQGMDTSPVQHWTQGAARALQGALGGYEMYQDDQRDKQSEADATKAYLNYLQPSPASPPSAAPPSPAPMPPQSSPVASALAKPVVMASNDPTAVSGPRPGGPVMPTGKVWGDQEAESAGLYEPSKPKGAAMALANPNAPIQPTPVQSVPVTPPVSPVTEALAPKPDVMAQAEPDAVTKIRAMLQATKPDGSPDRATRAMGRTLADSIITQSVNPKYDFKTAGDTLYRTDQRKGTAEPIKDVGRGVKPMSPEQRKEWGVPEGMSAGIDDNGKPVFSPAGTNINLNTQQNGLKKVQESAIEDMQAANSQAREATKRSGIWDTMEKSAQGFKPGATADIKLSAGRYLKDLGITSGDGVPDAEVFKQLQQQIAVHAQPKGQGSVSNAERELFAKAIPNITMSPEALQRSISISRGLDDFDRKVATIYRDNARKNGGVPNSVEINDEIDKLGSPLSVSDSSFLQKSAAGGGSNAAAPSKLKQKYGLD